MCVCVCVLYLFKLEEPNQFDENSLHQVPGWKAFFRMQFE